MEVEVVFVIIAILLLLCYLVIYIGTIVWAYRDAEERKKSGCLVAIIVAFLNWPLGLIVWLLLRPSRPNHSRG